MITIGIEILLSLALCLSLFGETGGNGRPWVHIEYGAANYDARRGGATLENLFETVDGLIQSQGVQGVFYVNDLQPGPTKIAAERLVQYLAEKNRYRLPAMPEIRIEVRALPGDYMRIALPRTHTAHLKHPENKFLLDPQVAADALLRMAQRSASGLELHTYYHREDLGVLAQTRSAFGRIESSLGNRLVQERGGAPYALPGDDAAVMPGTIFRVRGPRTPNRPADLGQVALSPVDLSMGRLEPGGSERSSLGGTIHRFCGPIFALLSAW